MSLDDLATSLHMLKFDFLWCYCNNASLWGVNMSHVGLGIKLFTVCCWFVFEILTWLFQELAIILDSLRIMITFA